jgi:GTP cyclohydrolase I
MSKRVEVKLGERPEPILPHKNETLLEYVKSILIYLGENHMREGLRDTPKRYLKFMHEFLTPEPFEYTTFSADGNDQMFFVGGIEFYSLCEHHIAPFFGTASVAYLPGEKIVGLSKIPRAVDKFSRRLQNQERITRQVASELHNVLHPRGVAVHLSARHMCMCMRGIKSQGAVTDTAYYTGEFLEKHTLQMQFLNQIHLNHVQHRGTKEPGT